MILAKVKSRVVATARLDSIPARPMFWVEPLEGFESSSNRMVAIDGAQSGPGDLVIVTQEGTGAREVLLDDASQPLPAQCVIVGVVDDVQQER